MTSERTLLRRLLDWFCYRMFLLWRREPLPGASHCLELKKGARFQFRSGRFHVAEGPTVGGEAMTRGTNPAGPIRLHPNDG